MKGLFIESGKMGAATLGMAFALQYLYKTTNFYPPNPVFWFFMGFNAKLALGLLERLTASVPAAGLGALGEDTIASIDAAIAQYQQNIAGLKKILRSGSPQGKAAAQQKLKVATKNLDVFRRKRASMVA